MHRGAAGAEGGRTDGEEQMEVVSAVGPPGGPAGVQGAAHPPPFTDERSHGRPAPPPVAAGRKRPSPWPRATQLIVQNLQKAVQNNLKVQSLWIISPLLR
jgi:hypothetical protein